MNARTFATNNLPSRHNHNLMNTQPVTTVFGLSTLESELRTHAEHLIVRATNCSAYPIVDTWHRGPLSIYVAPTDTGISHAPKNVLALARLKHGGISYTVFLGGI